jgi:RNA polymerase sigma factor (sigma-70 family)
LSLSEGVTRPLSAPTEDDEVLLLRLKSGDREALGILFMRYTRLVLSVGIRVLHDFAEAEDLVQDLFLLVFKKVELFDPEKGSARAWLARISYHRALDRRAYLIRRSFYITRSGSQFEFAFGMRDAHSEVELVEMAYWQSVIKRAFECLRQISGLSSGCIFSRGFPPKRSVRDSRPHRPTSGTTTIGGLERLRNHIFLKASQPAQ